MILVIDNYDSFTYNLVDLFHPYDEVKVRYPDDSSIFDLCPDVLVISPGPGHPDDTPYLNRIIKHFNALPILGVCLGAQALYRYYGGEVKVGRQVMHGKIDRLQFEQATPLYQNISEYSDIMRYHSLICEEITCPSALIITGRTEDAIQSFEHRTHLHYGIQYHPESFASPEVTKIVHNFMELAQKGVKPHDFA
ncbi:anthranilate synthase component II [Staphylococcus ratti]|uniref:Aminodeoxychorismate/anthranilate synthase component II n=1 Tax=Staphylococcus ratti TaxID=2892440 RepID=A0ABY3PDU0_9STAP|nr:aminodeoxychorismate/anthranilate synthase component II [Staphylococcus ratti]UEX90410.1 aminodeoxychorismate/anthranilate synthase component II [Staphylococcus ratti]